MIKKILIGLVALVVILSIVTAVFMQQNSFGKLPSGERLERVKKSKQYKNGAFENSHVTKMIADDASYFGMATKFFSKGIDREPVKDLPSVKTNLKNLPAEKPTLVWFGHSS